MSEDRIAALRRRVHRQEEEQLPIATEDVRQKKKTTRKSSRDRHSFYLDKSLVQHMDDVYRTMNHDAFPQDFSKSDFLEAIIGLALEHPEELRARLTHT